MSFKERKIELETRLGTKKNFRNFQLLMMGWIAIFIAPVTAFFTVVVYGLPFPASISETGTIANQVSPLLPFALGALALFSLAYSVNLAHDWLDRLCTALMTAGFTLVAFQMCASPYITEQAAGVFALTPHMSNIVHTIGAVVGFGAMIVWIGLCFTKSEKTVREQTPQKRIRNELYGYAGACMVASLALFIPYRTSRLGADFPIIWAVEAVMLIFGGLACLIKGGLFLKDKQNVEK